jgi:hypothetical protein
MDAGSVPVKTPAAQIWAFGALKGSGRTAPTDRPGADRRDDGRGFRATALVQLVAAGVIA